MSLSKQILSERDITLWLITSSPFQTHAASNLRITSIKADNLRESHTSKVCVTRRAIGGLSIQNTHAKRILRA